LGESVGCVCRGGDKVTDFTQRPKLIFEVAKCCLLCFIVLEYAVPFDDGCDMKSIEESMMLEKWDTFVVVVTR
jgi:hypothetical protein